MILLRPGYGNFYLLHSMFSKNAFRLLKLFTESDGRLFCHNCVDTEIGLHALLSAVDDKLSHSQNCPPPFNLTLSLPILAPDVVRPPPSSLKKSPSSQLPSQYFEFPLNPSSGPIAKTDRSVYCGHGRCRHSRVRRWRDWCIRGSWWGGYRGGRRRG